jgi:hypothetical protein
LVALGGQQATEIIFPDPGQEDSDQEGFEHVLTMISSKKKSKKSLK